MNQDIPQDRTADEALIEDNLIVPWSVKPGPEGLYCYHVIPPDGNAWRAINVRCDGIGEERALAMAHCIADALTQAGFA